MNIDTNQLEFIDSKLRNILIWTEAVTGLTFTVTGLFRIGDPGVHGTLPLRGVDLRMHYEPVGRVIEQLINDNYQYDYERPDMRCAILHGDRLHLHIQVHDNTVTK